MVFVPGTVSSPVHYSGAPIRLGIPRQVTRPCTDNEWVQVDALHDRAVRGGTAGRNQGRRVNPSCVRWRRRRPGRRQATRSYPLFVYLMSSMERPYIGLASNPFWRVKCHNRLPDYGPGAKSTRKGAPMWRLRIVIGPFFRGSDVFHAQWRDESRKLPCRLSQGCLKALSYRAQGLCVWADRPRQLVARTSRSIKRHSRRLESATVARRRIHRLSTVERPASTSVR